MVLCTATAMDAKDVESVKRPGALTVEQGAPEHLREAACRGDSA